MRFPKVLKPLLDADLQGRSFKNIPKKAYFYPPIWGI